MSSTEWQWPFDDQFIRLYRKHLTYHVIRVPYQRTKPRIYLFRNVSLQFTVIHLAYKKAMLHHQSKDRLPTVN